MKSDKMIWETFGAKYQDDRRTLKGGRLIAGYMGIVMILAGIITMLPLFTLFFYPEEIGQAQYFVAPGVSAILAGYLMSLVLRGRKAGRLEKNQEMIVVLGTWIIVIFVTAMPFVLTGNYTVTQAVFETTSGLSTTGLTVVNTGTAPCIFLIHRTVLLFFGGIGLVLVMTSVLSDVYGMRLYHAEGHSDRLLPNLIESARLVIGIYSGYILAGTLLYVLFGMSLFDAINHAVAALSTGGFSTKADSIGAYNSIVVETITNILMLLGTTNFAVLLLLVQGKFKKVWQVSEVQFLFAVLAVSVPLAAWSLHHLMFPGNIKESFRQAGFNMIAALSTTGFSTMGYQGWPQASIGIMILLMLIGGGIGSTAGGLKLTRVYILMRMAAENMKERVSSGRRISAPFYRNAQGRQPLDDRLFRQTGSFAVTYLLLFITGSLLLTVTAGCGLSEAMFEFASALGTVGLSIGVTGPETNNATLLVEMAGMLLGRLEIFIVPIGFYCLFDRIRAAGRNGRRSRERYDL